VKAVGRLPNPVKELKPKNAVQHRISESATFDDFSASFAAFLYEVESISSAVRPRFSSITNSVSTRRKGSASARYGVTNRRFFDAKLCRDFGS
jgi:hypothetical protein